MASAKVIAAHNVTDAAEAASIGARVDPKSGKWYSLADGHYIGPAEADQLLNRTTAQGNADRSNGNGGGYFDQLAARNQDSVGNLLKNIAPVAGLIPGVGPLIAGGVSALGQSIIPGANLGQDIKSGVQGGALGAGAGAIGSATGLTSTLGKALGAGLPTASPVAIGNMAADGTLANVANASAPIAAGSQAGTDLASALPNIGGAVGGASSAINGAKTIAGGLPSASPVSGNTDPNSITSLLSSLGTTIPGILGGINAANLQGQSQQYAQDALATQEANWNQEAPLRTAGIAGLLNPSTPAPGVGNLAALNTAASKGNPFATAVPLPSPSAVNSTASVVSGTPATPTTGLPTPSPLGTQPPVPPLPVSALPNGLPTAQPIGGGMTPQNLAS